MPGCLPTHARFGPRTLARWGLALTLLAQVGLSTTTWAAHPLEAEAIKAVPTPTLNVPVDTVYFWWLARYADSQAACTIPVAHEGAPTAGEVEQACGPETRWAWETTPLCQPGTVCEGLYLYLVDV